MNKKRNREEKDTETKTKKEKFISQLKAKTTTRKPLKQFQCGKSNGEMAETHTHTHIDR